jgi:hypothetical protein
MIRKALYLFAMMAVTSASWAQAPSPSGPRDHDIYCAGGFTNTPPPSDTYVITGQESDVRIVYRQDDLVYINRGSKQGVQTGNEFLVSRPVKDRSTMQWFVWQKDLMRSMGQAYADVGKLRVVHVDDNTSTAQIVLFCDQMQRGDIVVPFTARQAPNYKPEGKFDVFAPASGKNMAMVVAMRDFAQMGRNGSIIYVNLGAAQGVQVGDYFRIFRYQGDHHSNIFKTKDQERAVYGYGTVPATWTWENLPREVLGEGLVVNVSPNSSSVVVTESLREVFTGDYVEVE